MRHWVEYIHFENIKRPEMYKILLINMNFSVMAGYTFAKLIIPKAI